MNLQNIPEIFAGENRTITLYARDVSNAPVSLSAASISWRVGKGPSCPDSCWPVFTKTGTVTSAATGAFTVAVTPTDMRFMCGDYEHEAWATISAQLSLVTVGRLRVRPYITTGS